MSGDKSKYGKCSRWGAGPWGGENSGFSKVKMIYLGTEKRGKVRGRNGRKTEREDTLMLVERIAGSGSAEDDPCMHCRERCPSPN
jgi:hypothetical protein